MQKTSIVSDDRQNIHYYNEIAGEYDEILDREQSNNRVRIKVEQTLRSLLPSGSVLDFGGGTGKDLNWLVSAGFEVIFCEPSQGMREKAVRRNEESLHSKHIRFLEGEQTQFASWQAQPPFPGKTDAVLANFAVFNCIPEIELLFERLAFVLKPGGHLVALVLNSSIKKMLGIDTRKYLLSFLSNGLFTQRISYKGNTQTVYYYSETKIRRASAPFFNFRSSEIVRGSEFRLLHLVRK